MTEADLDDLLRTCPVAYHMADRGAWPSIRAHGLLSTSALLDLFGLDGAARRAVEAERRPEGVPLEAVGLPPVLVRDQKPMTDAGLRRCLTDGMTPEDWYRLLNAKAFFWLSRARLLRLLDAAPYRALEHDVLELDAGRLVRAHADRVRLCPINSGYTRRFPQPRGPSSFRAIADYPYADRPRHERVVELAIEGGVPDVRDFVTRVVRMRRDDEVEVLFQAPPPDPGQASSDPPPSGAFSPARTGRGRRLRGGARGQT